MRVAFVAEVTAQHEESGRTHRLRRIAELLANRGHEATVFCAQWWDGDLVAGAGLVLLVELSSVHSGGTATTIRSNRRT
ncbi:hypothetical protein [Haladaptatus sp.]|uniref:hypothetical protein n=1 Tax=Haladaptatus sp. TaxID=1973141 RepID=UPI003C4EDC5B